MLITSITLAENSINIEYYKDFAIVYILVKSLTGTPWWRVEVYKNHKKVYQQSEDNYQFAVGSAHRWIDRAASRKY